MKKILCFGDSNTFGFNPTDYSRYDKNIRWTGLLAEFLGSDFEIIEEGLNNRHCFTQIDMGKEYTGTNVLQDYLKQNPDCVVYGLGINDLQLFYNYELDYFEQEFNKAIQPLKDYKTIILCPAKISDDIFSGMFNFQFDKNSIEKSQHLPMIYKNAAEKIGAYCLDLNEFVKVSSVDGLHLEPSAHKILAQELAKMISSIFTQ